MASKNKCAHKGGYKMVGDELVCASCGEPSLSNKWRHNVYGEKAMDSDGDKRFHGLLDDK